MMDAETQDNVRSLDPFGFMVGYASAIRPLGGEERGPDPRYVFHTPYVEYRPCRVVFTVRLDKLQASFGELRVFVNAFVPGSGRDAVFVTSSRLDLTDRAAVERGLTISIFAVAGATYAAYGMCLDGTDARAADLTVTAEEVDGEGGLETAAFLLPTAFGMDTPLAQSLRLVAGDPPSFRDPTSQVMTDSQLLEPDYREWISRLPDTPNDNATRWRLAFIGQVLDRYGMLRPGARGIALGKDSDALAPLIAGAGCSMVQAHLPPDHVSDFSWNAVPCTPIETGATSDGVPPAPLCLADQPADARGFDFLWSIGMAELGFAAGHCANFLLEVMTVLRPGGYAVHLLDLARPGADMPGTLPRAEVERLAVTLISRGFTVAQLNFEAMTDQLPACPFGLIVRKA